MLSANGGLPAHRYTPQVTPRWPRGSEPASIFRRFARSCSCAPPFYALEFLDLKNLEMTIFFIKMCF